MIWLLLACGEAPQEMVVPNSSNMSDYTAFNEGMSWTYRNQGWNYDDPDLLLDSTLVLAQHQGDGLIEFRRGVSWNEGVTFGRMQFDMTDGGLALTEWQIPGLNGNGWYPFSDAEIVDGNVSEGDWTCTTTKPEEGAETYYAFYSSVVVFQCEGAGLESEWVFATGLGLVQMMTPEGSIGLELVAPW